MITQPQLSAMTSVRDTLEANKATLYDYLALVKATSATSSDQAIIKQMEDTMAENTSQTLEQIHVSSKQVVPGSSQMAENAQALVEGALEQSSAVEELQATITDIASQVSANAIQAEEAATGASSVFNEAVDLPEHKQKSMHMLIIMAYVWATLEKSIGLPLFALPQSLPHPH